MKPCWKPFSSLFLAAALAACGSSAGGGDPAGGGGSGGGPAEPVCGNGLLENGEVCDEGEAISDTAPDACRSDCTRARCGDGVIDAGEACDDDGAWCSDHCTLVPGCGNGVREGDEACDEGAANSDSAADACRTNCRLARCGDAVIDGGEECDAGDANDDETPDACRTSCVAAACGDGIRDSAEECDLGEENSDGDRDGCRTGCREAFCGDGVIDTGESCDRGEENSDTAPDTCRTTCVSPDCGDGTVDRGETCDLGEANSDVEPGGCRTSCSVAFCGDGVVDPGETCDGGEGNSDERADACRSTCVPAGCGDGVIDAGEECDDGNRLDDDWCSAACLLESTCGDGVREGLESCDDGNTDFGDGCGPRCSLEGNVCGASIVDLNAAAGWSNGNYFLYTSTSAGSGNDSTGTCSMEDGEDQTHALWVGRRARVELTTDLGASSGYDTILYVRTDCADLGAELACNDDSDPESGVWTSTVVLEDVAAGTQLYPTVDVLGFDAGGIPYSLVGTFSWYVGPGESCDPRGRDTICEPGYLCGDGTCIEPVCGDGILSPAAGERCDDGGTADGDGCSSTCLIEGDTCANAIVASVDAVTHVATAAGTTTGAATDASPSCNDAGAQPDVFVSFTAPERAYWDFTVQTTSWSTLIAAQATCGGTELACSNDVPFGSGDKVRIRLDQGESATLVVTGWGATGTQHGAFTLQGTPIPIVALNGSCDPSQATNVCDDGLYCGSGSTCVAPVCGNGTVELGEACDDGGTAAGDGCSSGCAWEYTDESEPNDTISTADSIAVGDRFRGAIGSGDQDWYAFSATSGTTYYLETFVGTVGACSGGTGSSTSTVIEIWDGVGNRYVFATSGGLGNCAATSFQPTTSGTYYALVREFWPGGTHTVAPYYLELTQP